MERKGQVILMSELIKGEDLEMWLGVKKDEFKVGDICICRGDKKEWLGFKNDQWQRNSL